MKATHIVSAALALLFLSACGGGGGNDDRPVAEEDTVPASALATSQSFSEWLGKRASNDVKEPLTMDGVLPPMSETDEPIDVN